MTPLLYNPPIDEPSWLFFGGIHITDHFQIASQIFELRGIRVPVWPIDPIPLLDSGDMMTWFQQHQAMHVAMNAAMGLGTADLSAIDFNNREMMAFWIELNASEHQNISFAAAAFRPSPQAPPPIITQPIQPQPTPSAIQAQPPGTLGQIQALGGIQQQPGGTNGIQLQPDPAVQAQPNPALQPQPAPLPQTAPFPQSVPQPAVPAAPGFQPPGTQPPFLPTLTA